MEKASVEDFQTGERQSLVEEVAVADSLDRCGAITKAVAFVLLTHLLSRTAFVRERFYQQVRFPDTKALLTNSSRYLLFYLSVFCIVKYAEHVQGLMLVSFAKFYVSLILVRGEPTTKAGRDDES